MSDGESHVDVVCPPSAPLIMTRCVVSTRGFADACPVNVHELHGRPPPCEQNSCVVFDIPLDSSTYFPVALGLPAMSSGSIASARALPSEEWIEGTTFEPPGYRPP